LVDENLLFEKIEASQQDDNLQGEGGELPYRPDQPRAPKGQSNGGQWIKDNSSPNGGGIKSLNKAPKNIPSQREKEGIPEGEEWKAKDIDDLIYREPNMYSGEEKIRSLDDPERFEGIKAVADDLEKRLATLKDFLKDMPQAQRDNMIQNNKELEKSITPLSQEPQNSNSSEPSLIKTNKYHISDSRYNEMEKALKETDSPVVFTGTIDTNRNSKNDFKRCGLNEELDIENSSIGIQSIRTSETETGSWYAEDQFVGNLPKNKEVSFAERYIFKYEDKDGNPQILDIFFLLRNKTDENGETCNRRGGGFLMDNETLNKEYKNLEIEKEFAVLSENDAKNLIIEKFSPQEKTDKKIYYYPKQHVTDNFRGGEIKNPEAMDFKPIYRIKIKITDPNNSVD
ncbi:MAG: hypothetical protein J6T16_08180, partial [Opitutales bacterium]|nr:hypothetical protein [Opitutales bacterium]